MNRQLSGRESEEEPTVPYVNVWELQDVAKEFSVGLGAFAVDDGMGPGDHSSQNKLIGI
jgi:hypothetical protein